VLSIRLAGSRSRIRALASRWLHSHQGTYFESSANGHHPEESAARRKRSWRRSTTTKKQTLELGVKGEQSTGEYSGDEEDQRTAWAPRWWAVLLIGLALWAAPWAPCTDGEHHLLPPCVLVSFWCRTPSAVLDHDGSGHCRAAHLQRVHHRRGPGLIARYSICWCTAGRWHAEGRIHRGIRKGAAIILLGSVFAPTPRVTMVLGPRLLLASPHSRPAATRSLRSSSSGPAVVPVARRWSHRAGFSRARALRPWSMSAILVGHF